MNYDLLIERMSMTPSIKVYIEIEKDSNMKYEYNKQSQQLELDRILPAPFVYPFAYGFIPNTLAADGDDLDALIIHPDGSIRMDTTYDVHVVGALRMEDEHGADEKVLCVLDAATVVTDAEKAAIEVFFSTYKIGYADKWSKTNGFMDRQEAIALVERCRQRQADRTAH